MTGFSMPFHGIRRLARELGHLIWPHATECAAAFAVCVLGATLANASVVRMDTTLGPLYLELYDDEAPVTVTNFLRYAGAHLYDGTLLRSGEWLVMALFLLGWRRRNQSQPR